MYFSNFFDKKPLILINLLSFLAFWSKETLNIDKVSLPKQKYSKNSMGILIERAHYYTIFVEGVRTIREGALTEGGVLTEVVRYIKSNKLILGICLECIVT